jgi:hypothetical protein
MVQRSRLQEAAERLLPLRQGQFDNLCGLYSILNAIRLVHWPTLELHAHRSRKLFQHGICALEREGLLHDVLKQGMDEKTWTWLGDTVLAEASKLTGISLRRLPILEKVKKTDIDAALAIIDRHTRKGQPVLAELGGGYNHYTVIVGMTANKLQLFDSYGYRWIAAASCELDHRRAVARHQIGRRSAAAICKGR